jgi:hypothetical protein
MLMNHTFFASFWLVATSAAMLVACEPLDDVANAASAEVPQVSTAAVYFGDEYAAAQWNLPPSFAPAAPTF